MHEDPSSLVTLGYNKIAQAYHQHRDQFKNQMVLERYASTLPASGHMLDLGCGSGVPISKFFLEKGYAVTGIDISQSMLELAKEHLPGATLLKQSMTQLDFPDASFDGIVCFYALFHVPKQKHQGIITRMYQLLKPGCSFALSVGTSAWEGIEDFYGTQMYWSHFEPEAYEAMIKETGFELLFSESVHDGLETHHWIIGRKQS